MCHAPWRAFYGGGVEFDPRFDDGYGEDVALEQRDIGELLEVDGQRLDIAAFNPVFDVTPADLIDVIVTEKGIVERPDTAKLAKLMCRKRLH